MDVIGDAPASVITAAVQAVSVSFSFFTVRTPPEMPE
jgi:hypothetical protein